ncbi:MAG: DUF968 domain-containing protein [FCB group bacterium]|nr:DUF968 domain-containing protein [FCB group bacterium]
MTPMPKIKMYRNPRYLKWLRTQPCAACGAMRSDNMDIVAAHQRDLPGHGGGTGIKPHDTYCLPLCDACHKLSHQGYAVFADTAESCLDHFTRFLAQGGKP